MPSKNDDKVILCDDQLQYIVEQIEASREINSVEHAKILKNSEESAELAENIQALVDKWNSFWSVIMALRTATFTVGFLIAMAYFITNWAEVFNKVGG